MLAGSGIFRKLVSCMATACLLIVQAQAQNNQGLQINFPEISQSHDIRLSPWGPYSKKYAGISHIYSMDAGMRFDFSVLPGFYRNKILIPNVNFESGYFPWYANKDLTHYTYRYELEWKDKVYTDISYRVVDSNTVLVIMHCVNNSSLPQNLSLNLVYGIEYPENHPSIGLSHSENSAWLNATAYASYESLQKKPKDNLVTDGWIKGEIRDSAFIDGCAIGQGFGREKGDRLRYKPVFKKPHPAGTIRIFYRMRESLQTRLTFSGCSDSTITLTGSGKIDQLELPYKCTPAMSPELLITAGGGSPLELNGLLFIPAGEEGQTQLYEQSRTYSAASTQDLIQQRSLSKYKSIPDYYGFCWDGHQDFRFRQILNDELDVFFRRLVHSHVDSILKGNSKGDYSNIFIRPVELQPQSSKTIYGLLCNGDSAMVQNRMSRFASIKETFLQEEKQKNTAQEPLLAEGSKYLFSQKMLQATVLTDIVYPIYTQGNYIRHFTPGKWWNSLYTWDLGFIALGLNQININKAAECINAYTTPLGSQSAFIHHGSPVPTQFYAFLDLWNKTQSKPMLLYFYPRLKQYYEFLSGRLGSSTTVKLSSKLLKTWDYFYNSGGWDDYPAQVEVHRQKAESSIAPVINTAQQIRIGKIMRMAAEALGKKEDIALYDQDINTFSSALQKYSWNSASGYFSYVVHDKDGRAVDKLLYADSVDFNKGLDGAYPLMAGICNPLQQETLTEKIFSAKNMWTPSGISVVDQSAPYYKKDGYWNGSVWMPHQWFVWKTMLDLGKGALAAKIANTGLEVYSKETDSTYYTFEHFLAASGRGAGWHQFSGLSTPPLNWFAAYYKPGTVTAGFEIWIRQQSFNKDLSSYEAGLSFDKATVPHKRILLVCMNALFSYSAAFNGKPVPVNCPYQGLLEITLPASNQEGKLVITVSKK